METQFKTTEAILVTTLKEYEIVTSTDYDESFEKYVHDTRLIPFRESSITTEDVLLLMTFPFEGGDLSKNFDFFVKLQAGETIEVTLENKISRDFSLTTGYIFRKINVLMSQDGEILFYRKDIVGHKITEHKLVYTLS